MKTKYILLLFCALLFTAAQAQEILISGTVVDQESQTPIPGVNVLIKGTNKGTSSDFDGHYQLQVNKGDLLEFSVVGMKSVSVTVGDESVINITLEEDTQALEEVVVIGYGTQRKADLTGSITTVKSEEIEKTPTSNVMQSLQGKVAGLQVVSNGSPGDSPTIRLRGVGSFLGSAASSPLFVVDGMFYDNIDFLNTSDITSISVLKDASAAAIYGVRAANGVVLIETKSGSYNRKVEFTYDGYTGYQVAQNVLKMANAEQFTTMAYESGSQPDINNVLAAMQRYGRSRINPNIPDVNTDWYKELLRDATIMSHSISADGGGEKATYAIGGNYFSQEGILDMKNEYERFNLRSKIDFKISDRFTIGGNMILSNATKYNAESGAWNQAYFAVPILPVYDALNTNATPINYASAEHLGYRNGQNPFPTLEFNNNRTKIRKVLANFNLKYDIIPDMLSFKTMYSHAFTSLRDRNVNLPYYVSDSWQRPISSLTKTSQTYSNQIWDNTLTFNKDVNDHHFTLMAGTSYRDDEWDYLTARGTELFSPDHEQAWYLGQTLNIDTDNVNDNGYRQYGFSYFGRVSYNYKDRYLVYGTMRADGSSKYQEKWGYFPAIGIGWVISEEEFMADNTFFDFLKLRASWGKLGNNLIQATNGDNTTTLVNTAFDDVQYSGSVASSTFSYLEWELTEEYNYGISSRLLENRLSVEADYYIRDTKNAAIPVIQPLIGSSVLRNAGEIRNSGLELAVDWSDNISADFKYSIGANIATLTNEVRDLYGQSYLNSGSAEFRQRSIVGEPLSAFYGYQVTGVYQNDAQVQADPIAVENNLVPGDLMYKDQNGDGLINDDDRTVLGSYFPSFMYGANLGLSYKSFEFTVSMYGQTGNEILNRKRGEIIWTPDGNMDADLAINRWHGEGTSNSYPSSAGLRKGWNQKMSDFYVEDGAFFRIQNLQLAYNLASEMLGENMPDIRISLTAERPYTSFKYNGFNPEVSNGIDTQTYPIPAIYTVGLNVKF